MIEMGRTNPTFRDVLRRVEDRWQPFRRALRYEDQQRFDRLLEYAQTHADAAGNLNHQAPIVAVLLAIALAQERRIDEQREQFDELERQANEQAERLDKLEDRIDEQVARPDKLGERIDKLGGQTGNVAGVPEGSPHERTG